MEICFVTHRYPPMPGGTAAYVASLAEESLRRGVGVTVLTEQEETLPRQYVHGGVRVVTDPGILSSERFDLVVIHAADGTPQQTALINAKNIPSPILYLLIFPQVISQISDAALAHITWAGCSTDDDWKYLSRHLAMAKGRVIRHGADPKKSLGEKGRFRSKFGISSRYLLLSCGGFWRHKGHAELVSTFSHLGLAAQDTTLVITGYREGPRPAETEGVRVLHLVGEEGRQDVRDAMADADLYIMNSYHEGFGISLIEAMMNRLPWMARSTVAGATEMFSHGFLYRGSEGLLHCLARFREIIGDRDRIEKAHHYAMTQRTTGNSVDDLLAVAAEARERQPR